MNTTAESSSAQVVVYGLRACSTCAKAVAWLNAHGVDHRFVDYRENPISPQVLSAWAATLGWEKLVNRASYTWRDLPAERKQVASATDWLTLIAEFPALIKRPVVTASDGVQVGFSEKRFSERFGTA
ncbi:MAG: Spx/MgsR family RNA polymerase-binding regulatory protein [Lysobacteraceae bacterium]